MGKGLIQRFNEALAGDYDDYYTPLLLNLIANVQDPRTAFDKYLSYLETTSGQNVLFIGSNNRRKVLHLLDRLYSIKGTEEGYRTLFRMIGFNADVADSGTFFYLDHEVATLDWDARAFDSKCSKCNDYILSLSRIDGNPTPLTNIEIQQVRSIILFNEPINARMVELLVDGDGVAFGEYDENDFSNDFNI